MFIGHIRSLLYSNPLFLKFDLIKMTFKYMSANIMNRLIFYSMKYNPNAIKVLKDSKEHFNV